MNSPMSEPTASGLSVRSAVAMLAFTLVFTALMAGAHLLTHEKIAKSAEAEKLLLIDQILPRSLYDNDLLHDTLSVPASAGLGMEPGSTVWRARKAGRNEALVLEAAAPDGYGGRIALIVAIGADGRIRGVRATEHHETPGLGDYIDPKKDKSAEHKWIRQFETRAIDAPESSWRVRKDGGDFDYHAGATISARAVTRAVGRVARYVATHREELFAPAR